VAAHRKTAQHKSLVIVCNKSIVISPMYARFKIDYWKWSYSAQCTGSTTSFQCIRFKRLSKSWVSFVAGSISFWWHRFWCVFFYLILVNKSNSSWCGSLGHLFVLFLNMFDKIILRRFLENCMYSWSTICGSMNRSSKVPISLPCIVWMNRFTYVPISLSCIQKNALYRQLQTKTFILW